MPDLLEEIKNSGLCLGCGACVAAISRDSMSMIMSEDGYLRPESKELLDASEQEILTSVCAGRSLSHDTVDEDYHPLWGPIKWLGTGYAIDVEVRHRGSSGGVISAIAIGLIEKGMVDFVLATVADPSDPIGNFTGPQYNRADILGAAGSRYAPSSPLSEIETHLSAGRRFAFIGKPCDVAALRRMAKRDARIDTLIPYMIAFFCAGVPSRKGTLKVLDALGVAPAEVKSFRYRGDGWPGLARAIRHDGSEETMDYNSSWGNILNRYLQFRCKICPDGTGEFADIACADAWYGADGYPDFTERDGRSLIVARTQVGNQLIQDLTEDNRIAVDLLKVEEISKMQPYQVHRKQHVRTRVAAMWLRRRTGPHYTNLSLDLAAKQVSFSSQLRDFIGTLRRLTRKNKTLS